MPARRPDWRDRPPDGGASRPAAGPVSSARSARSRYHAAWRPRTALRLAARFEQLNGELAQRLQHRDAGDGACLSPHRLCPARPSSVASTSSESPQTASAASSSQPPANTPSCANNRCSAVRAAGNSSRSWPERAVPRGTSRGPATSRSSRRPSLSRSAVGSKEPVRAAASSIESGKPFQAPADLGDGGSARCSTARSRANDARASRNSSTAGARASAVVSLSLRGGTGRGPRTSSCSHDSRSGDAARDEELEQGSARPAPRAASRPPSDARSCRARAGSSGR